MIRIIQYFCHSIDPNCFLNLKKEFSSIKFNRCLDKKEWTLFTVDNIKLSHRLSEIVKSNIYDMYEWGSNGFIWCDKITQEELEYKLKCVYI